MPGSPEQRVLTLVSGDHVTFTGSGSGVQVLGIRPAEGRERTGFSRIRVEGHEYVIPVDATEALASGRLDRRLFDVTTLAAQGHDDTRRTGIPLIATPAAAESIRPEGSKSALRGRDFHRLGLVTRDLPKSQAAQAWKGFVRAGADPSRRTAAAGLWLDAEVHATLDESVPMTGAPEAWRQGMDGKGVEVAVLDSGYDTGHPDLKAAVTEAEDFTPERTVQDHNGHGTHVASTVAGDGSASAGRLRGVAPGADLLIGKVLDSSGSGYTSWILAGMEWAAAQGADVVSMSLGNDEPSDGRDPLSAAVDTLSADGGPLFVVASGNRGMTRAIGSPAAATSALTVGSVTKQGALSSFSSRGPALTEGGVKPEITAPGSSITAARAAGTLEGAAADEKYATLSGTSMATPHVSGAAAIIKQAHPGWDAQRLKAALVGAARPVKGENVYAQGSGSVHIPGALASPVSASPSQISAAPFAASTERTTRELTYRNDSAKPVRLALSVTGDAPVALAERKLTVPPGGSADATLRVDTSKAEAGTYSAWITAKGPGGTTVRTPVGIDVQAPAATLTLKPGEKRAGITTATAHVIVQNEQTGRSQLVPLGEQAAQVSLPQGAYRVFGDVWESTVSHGTVVSRSSVAYARRLTLSGDHTLALDVSKARPVVRTVDDEDVVLDVNGSSTGVVSQAGGLTPGIVTSHLASSHGTYTVGSGRIPGLSFFSATSWEQPAVRAVATAVGGKPVDIPVRLESMNKQEWDLSAPVTDAGDGADLEGVELRDRVVLFDPTWDTPRSEATRRYEAIKAQNPAAVLLASGSVAYEETDPPLGIDPAATTTLRGLLSDGPVALRVTGSRDTERGYFTFHAHEDGVPAGITWADRRAGLAAVEQDVRAPERPEGYAQLYAWATYQGLQVATQTLALRTPERMTMYYTPDIPWTTATFVYNLPDFDVPIGVQYRDGAVYRRGENAGEGWLQAPFNPSLSGVGPDGRPQVTRDGDKLRMALPMLSDAAGHRTGFVDQVDAGRTELRAADGTVVDTNDSGGRAQFDMPRPARWYELSATTRRAAGVWPLSTEVSTDWRFPSGHTTRETALPLLDVRYDMTALDGTDAAPADEPFTFGVDFAFQKGSRGGDVNRATASWSSDDGATWHDAVVSGRTSDLRITVPGRPAGWVSLKVHGETREGAAVTETLVRAYRVGCPDPWCDTRR
ncbi:S8 family serine peptidase [Streptomyces sp. NPDC102473]|uniref:S8 family serine peptidase n=1 Tax=Streptomyces sp. NPDC102473 TaxID=3366180 RepID=UPI0037FCAC3B